MSPELSDTIRKAYPQLCTDYGVPGTEMRVGFAIADGWAQLFQQLLAEIEAERLKLPSDEAAKVKLAQVKEKWGQLRVYVDNVTEAMRGILDRIEYDSASVCERCGTSGDGVYPSGGGWVQTLCPSCRGERSGPSDSS